MEIIHLSPADVRDLMVRFTQADLHGSSVRIAVDGGVKVSVAQGMWTAPMGKKQERN